MNCGPTVLLLIQTVQFMQDRKKKNKKRAIILGENSLTCHNEVLRWVFLGDDGLEGEISRFSATVNESLLEVNQNEELIFLHRSVERRSNQKKKNSCLQSHAVFVLFCRAETNSAKNHKEDKTNRFFAGFT